MERGGRGGRGGGREVEYSVRVEWGWGGRRMKETLKRRMRGGGEKKRKGRVRGGRGEEKKGKEK